MSHLGAWAAMLPADPLPWLLASDEPAARWIALVHLLDRPLDDPEVVAAHSAVLAGPLTADLLGRLSPWDAEVTLSGHERPEFAPNLLSMLADMGVTAGDDVRIAGVLDSMLEHQAADGRFLALGRWRTMDSAVWAALPCDSHAIAETLARAGHGDDPRVERAFSQSRIRLPTPPKAEHGSAFPTRTCRSGGRGARATSARRSPSRRCGPSRTSHPSGVRPEVVSAGRVSLRVWRERGESTPYMFGHGRKFKRTKWPATWYSAFEIVDTLGRYPELWDGPDASAEDRRSLAELGACVVAYNFDDEGRVVPRSTYRGFEQHSFGQKKLPSAFAAARTAVALRRLEPIADEIAEVDVLALGSSRGGSGTPLPP